MNTCLVIPGVGASHGVRRETAGRIVKGRRERLLETAAEDPPVQIENCVQGAAPKTKFECFSFKLQLGMVVEILGAKNCCGGVLGTAVTQFF